MAMRRDSGGAVWVDTLAGDLVCVIDPKFIAQYDGDVIGEPFKAEYVERTWGPLVEVRPTGWEEV